MQAHDPVHACSEPFVVRSDQRGATLAPDKRKKLLEHAVGSGFVEIARRFVCKDEIRAVGQSARHGNALLLAARKLAGPVIEPVSKAERSQQLFGPRLCILPVNAGNELGKDDILARIEIGQQMVELVDEPEVIAPQAGACIRIALFRRMARTHDLTAEATFEKAYSLQ